MYSKDEMAEDKCYKWREKGYNIDMCNKEGAVYFVFAAILIISEPFFSCALDQDFRCFYPCEIMLSQMVSLDDVKKETHFPQQN